MRGQWKLPVLLLLVAATARAQEDPAGATQRVRAEVRVQTALQMALQAGIPVELLERKVAEGKAKGVPMERIAAAVETRLMALTRARSALQRGHVEDATAGDLSIAGDAVQAGVSDNALAELVRNAPRERRAVAVAVLTNLVSMGQASERALAQVQAAMGRGPEALLNLEARTSAQAREHGNPDPGSGGIGVGADASAGARGGVKVDPPGKGRGGGKGG